jgi:cytosine/adenosine deaminase-related metal-dependent hydrolase
MILRGVEIVGDAAPARDVVISGAVIADVRTPAEDSFLSPSSSRAEARVAAERSEAKRAVPGADDFDLHGAIAFPGLINSHDHLEFDVYPSLAHKRYADWREWGEDIHRRDRAVIDPRERVPRPERLRWGALRNLLCGVTTVAHHGPARDDRAPLPVGRIRSTSIHSVRLARGWRWRINEPIARPPYVVHVAEGTSAAARAETADLVRWNLFGRPLIAVHAIAMRPEQAAHFHAIVWCPLSNELLYGATAEVAALKASAPILLGTDATLSGDWNVWTHLRRARALGALDDRELYGAVTSTAALAWNRRDLGRIAPGYAADVVVARKKAHDRWEAFFALDPEDLLLVVRAGRVVVCDASLAAGIPRGRSSTVWLSGREKHVDEEVPAMIASLRRHGVEPNGPVGITAPGIAAPASGP